MPAVLALLASLVWGTSDFVGGLAARRIAVPALVLCSQTVGLLVLVVTCSAGGFWELGGRSLAWGVTAGAVSIVALAAFYWGLAVGPMGVVSPVAATGVLVPFAGGLARGEHPHVLQLAGAGCAIVGVVVAARPPQGGTATRGRLLPVALGLAAAVGFGVVLLGVQEGSRDSPAMTLLWMRATGVTLFSLVTLVVLLRRRPTGPWPGFRDVPAVLLVGTFDLGANALYAAAGRGHLLSVVAVLASLYPVVTAVLAWRVTGERLGRTQTAGVGGVLLGVVLLAAG